MKYAVCIDKMVENKLVGKDMKIMKASDPTVLKDALCKIIALDNKISYKKMRTCCMDRDWTSNNNSNTTDRGAFIIHEYTKRNELHFIVYYRRIRDTDMITIKEEVDE